MMRLIVFNRQDIPCWCECLVILPITMSCNKGIYECNLES